jgi:hypothetical protein
MHLASTFANLFVAGGKPYLRASVGHQINLGEFFEKVGTTLIAQFPREPLAAWDIGLESPSHTGFRQVTRFSAGAD